MLEEILDSSPKSILIGLLIMLPERSFSIKELSTRSRISEPATAKILAEFDRLTMVASFIKGKQKYYLLNNKHKLVSELKSSLRRNILPHEDELFGAIRKLGDVRASFLSGIFTGQPQLPVDILLVGKINLIKLQKFLANCKKMMQQDINYSVMSEDEYILRRNTFDRFIKDIFDYRHLVVVDKLTVNKPLPSKSKPRNLKIEHQPDNRFGISHF